MELSNAAELSAEIILYWIPRKSKTIVLIIPRINRTIVLIAYINHTKK